MGFYSRFIICLGLVLLTHAGYSAHEHSTLYSNARSSLPSSPALPLDITIETLVAVLLVSSALVLGAEKLKPISWNVWAGEIEREGGSRNPYNVLEYRPGFWDVRIQTNHHLTLAALDKPEGIFQVDTLSRREQRDDEKLTTSTKLRGGPGHRIKSCIVPDKVYVWIG
ncbi:Membrane magnesium transporter domain containing protein [Elaphomyces granulatus]